MEFLLTAIALLGAALVVALVCVAAITIAARRYVPQVAKEPVGTIIIACLGVLIHLFALLWVI